MKKLALITAMIFCAVMSAFAERPEGLYLTLDDNATGETVATDTPVTFSVDATGMADIDLYVGDVTGRPVASGHRVNHIDGKVTFDKPGEYVIIAYATGRGGAQAIASERVTVAETRSETAPRLTASAR